MDKKSNNKKGGRRGQSNSLPPGLAELFAQQQSQQNPLSLLQQQMNAIMTQPNQQQQQQQQQQQMNNPAAAYWYLEYLSRIQQMQQQEEQQQQTPPPPRPSSSSKPKKTQPQKVSEKRPSTGKRKEQPDALLNLSKSAKVPRTQTPLPPQQAASTSSNSPPPAHTTPINLSKPPTNNPTSNSPPPAHVVTKAHYYTHMIPKPPPLGLIVKKEKKKKTVASLLAQSREPYRPWVEDKIIIPSPKKEPPDYSLPLKFGFVRETLVKNTDYESVFEGPVTYITPQGIKCKSVNEIKKCLNQRTQELTPKHFTFGNLPIGVFTFDYEGEFITLGEDELDRDVLSKLNKEKNRITKIKKEEAKQKAEEQKQALEAERKLHHSTFIKQLEQIKKHKRRLKQSKQEESDVFELNQEKQLKPLQKLETCLDPVAFSNLLQINEFLNTFGETLGFDMDSLPDLESLLKGFINQTENEEELQSILIHLIVCAVEDPGMANPTKHMTTFNQTLKQADVNFGSLSEILRIYFEGISDSEPEAETYAKMLNEAPFTCHNPKRKTMIVAFLCDVLLQNKAVLKHLESSYELINNCKKERASNEVKIRKLRMILARKAVASACEDEEELQDEEEEKLSVEELKTKMNLLVSSSEKLKKQMQANFKSIRTPSLGQDRFRRRYWNLPHSGGIYAEPGLSGEFEELKERVALKLESGENEENIPPAIFEVPPPVLKIFSLGKEVCSGVKAFNDVSKKDDDDEILVKKVKKEFWSSYFKLDQVEEFSNSLLSNGLREKDLRNVLSNVTISSQVPLLEDTEELDPKIPPLDPELVYKIHLTLLETLESLEERVAGASLQIKNWTLPLPRNLYMTNPKQESIIELAKQRILDLEQAVERRYLKPPLGKSANELNLSNLVGEENVSAVGCGVDAVVLQGPCGSTSSTRGQQIQENNKLREMKEKEERLMAANEVKQQCSRFLTHWRDSVRKTTSASVLSMALYLLDSSIAWDKSVMKACCQLCKGGDHEDKLLLCDACDRGYHTYCFKPPLEQIPEGDWFCYECINKATGSRGCIVCGKGNLQGKKLLACDKCVKAFHTDCIVPSVSKVPRGRWYCPDHQPNTSLLCSKKIESPSKKKRPVTPVSENEIIEEKVEETKKIKGFEWCEKVLEGLMAHEDAWPFLEPVNTRQFPTYRKIIRNPIDLSSIRARLTANGYKTRENFLSDIRLIFDNCETFNEDDSPVGKAGHNLRVFFDAYSNDSD